MKLRLCLLALRNALLALSLSITATPALFDAAAAQEASRPLEFEVRPSGVEEETPEDRLDRRLKQREALFRSICIHCARGERFQSNAPFHPIQTLGKPMPD